MAHPLSTQDKLFLVEAAYGRAALRAHGIERMLTTWLICALCSRSEPASWKTEVAIVKRLTLGELVKRFVAGAKVTEELANELSLILALRNELVHQISDQFANAAVHDDWQYRVAAELSELSERLARCRHSLRPYMEQANELAGITDEEVRSEIRRRYPLVRIDA